MKLKTFNTTNMIVQRSTYHFLFMNKEAGLISFNGKICEELGLTDKYQIQFHQDEADQSTWYLEVVKKDGFSLRINYSKGAKGLFHSNER